MKVGRGLKNFTSIKGFKISFLVLEMSSFRHVNLMEVIPLCDIIEVYIQGVSRL